MSSSSSVTKEIISSPHAPPALASYSQAVRAGNTLYWSETEAQSGGANSSADRNSAAVSAEGQLSRSEKRPLQSAQARNKRVLFCSAAELCLTAYLSVSAAVLCVSSSGCLGMDKSGAMVSGGVEAECEQALKNLAAVLEAGGSTLENVLKTTVFLTTMDNYTKVRCAHKQHHCKHARRSARHAE